MRCDSALLAFRRLFSRRLWWLGSELRQELQHAVEVGEPRAEAIEKVAEGVVAVGEALGVFVGLGGDIREKLGMDFRERFGGMAAGRGQFRVGFLPCLELSVALSLLERDLVHEFGE